MLPITCYTTHVLTVGYGNTTWTNNITFWLGLLHTSKKKKTTNLYVIKQWLSSHDALSQNFKEYNYAFYYVIVLYVHCTFL